MQNGDDNYKKLLLLTPIWFRLVSPHIVAFCHKPKLIQTDYLCLSGSANPQKRKTIASTCSVVCLLKHTYLTLGFEPCISAFYDFWESYTCWYNLSSIIIMQFSKWQLPCVNHFEISKLVIIPWPPAANFLMF